jgi:S-adenosylmethionine hydrolase
MTKAIVTLLTDFGTKDFFVAAVKGALLSECPECRLVDITHEVEIFDIRRAAFLLWATWRTFPEGTTHLTVVDPGVGTQRALLYLEREGHHFFAPDNGLLTYVYSGQESLHIVDYPADLKAKASPTFHARDLFAPCVGRFVKGDKLDFKPCDEPVLLPYQPPMKGDGGIVRGQIMEVDRFGNIITDIPVVWLSWGEGTVKVHGKSISGWAGAYEDLKGQEAGMLRGSLGTLELAVRRGSASKVLGASIGEPILYQP